MRLVDGSDEGVRRLNARLEEEALESESIVIPELPLGLRLYRKGDLGGHISPPSDKVLIGPIGEWLSLVVPETESSLAAIGGGVLAALGSWLGPNIRMDVGNITHKTNLLVVVVGPSSFARKGTAWRPTSDLFFELDPTFLSENVTGGFGSGERVVREVADETFNKKGELLYGSTDQRRVFSEGEFARVLRVGNREGAILHDILRLAFDGTSPLHHNTIRGGKVVSSNHHITLYGGITPEELNLHITATSAVNGFVNRFLWVWSDNHDLLPDGGGDPDIDAIVTTILRGTTAGRTLYGRTSEAVEWWREHYPELRNLPHVSDNLRPLVSRTTDFVQRVALIYAATEGASAVDVRHLEAGLAWSNHSIDTASSVLGGVADSAMAAKVLHSLREHPGRGSSRRDIFRATGRNHTAAEIDAAMESLEAGGLIHTWTGVSSEGTGGKPAQLAVATSRQERL